MRTYITELCEGGHHSTAKSYQDALNSFKRFSGREEIPYTYINNENLLFYQNFGETLRRQIGETCGEPAGRGEGLLGLCRFPKGDEPHCCRQAEVGRTNPVPLHSFHPLYRYLT